MEDVVQRYYSEHVLLEWERLESAIGQIEFMSTMNLISKYFPKHGHIGDFGCGCGRYSIELLNRGYEVTMLDFTKEMLEFATMKLSEYGLKPENIICQDARNLSNFPDASLDGILLMGPMYHVTDKNDREGILHEVNRILKPEGVALVAYLNSWGILRTGLTDFPESFSDRNALSKLLDESYYDGDGDGFTKAYYSTPAHALEEVKGVGFEVITYAGVEGFASGMSPQLGKLQNANPVAFRNVVEFAVHTSELQQYRDITDHLHIVIKK